MRKYINQLTKSKDCGREQSIQGWAYELQNQSYAYMQYWEFGLPKSLPGFFPFF